MRESPPPSSEDEYGAQPPPDRPPQGTTAPNFRTLAVFCAEFRPISYAVAALMREGSLYTCTGRTGEGKTAFLVKLALAIATGRADLIGREVKKGRVAFATAENPDDLRMRFMVACYVFNIDVAVIDRDILVSDNRVSPEAITAWIKGAGETFTLIVVDTWQAFFDGKDANNPTQAVEFTRRFRPLTSLKGSPVVVIAAHPPKQAPDDGLLPYGGGSTLNEVDGNFTIAIDASGYFRFHWLGKIRGAPFEPLFYRIDRLDSPDVLTIEGARVQMPVMFPVAQEDVEKREAATANRDLALLKAMSENPRGSMQDWAAASEQKKRAVQTALQGRLRKQKLVSKTLGRWTLTDSGRKALREASGGRTDAGTADGAGRAGADA
jgi:hypothetical protein